MSDQRREAFDKAGYWPNEVMWKAWNQAWDAALASLPSATAYAAPVPPEPPLLWGRTDAEVSCWKAGWSAGHRAAPRTLAQSHERGTPLRSESGESFCNENEHRELLQHAREMLVSLNGCYPLPDTKQELQGLLERIDGLLEGAALPPSTQGTPRTDAVIREYGDHNNEPAQLRDLARQLERERNELECEAIRYREDEAERDQQADERSARSSTPTQGRLIAAIEAIQRAYTSRDKFPCFELWAELDAARLEVMSTPSAMALPINDVRCALEAARYASEANSVSPMYDGRLADTLSALRIELSRLVSATDGRSQP